MLQFSRIVEADQRIFNGKVFPFILEAFGITDWKLILQQPEEKAEATRIQFAQQRVMIASSLSQMGFTIELQPGVNSLDEIDFKISGEATKQNAGGGGGGYSEGGDEGGFGQDPEQDPGQDQNDATQFSFSKSNWTEQLLKKGVSISSIGDVQVHQNGLTTMLFVDKAQNMVAVFSPLGALVDVYKYMPIVKGKSLKAPIVKTSIDPEDTEDEDAN